MTAGPMIGVERTDTGARAVLCATDDDKSAPDHLLATAEVTDTATTAWLTDLLAALVDADVRAAEARGIAVTAAYVEQALAATGDLARIGCVRLAASSDDVVPPLMGWPVALRARLLATAHVLRGGCDWDGTTLGFPSDAEVDAWAASLRSAAVEAVSVVATFSPVDERAEVRMAAALAERLPGVPCSVSHSLGSIGLLERENASALNAALLPMAQRVTTELVAAAHAVLPGVGVYFARLDGTVMDVPYARRFPVWMLGSGAACRVRGAARLAGHRDALILDTIAPANRDAAGERRMVVVRDGQPSRSPRGGVVAGIPTSLPTLDFVPLGPSLADLAQAAQAVGAADLPWVAAQIAAQASNRAQPGDRVITVPMHVEYAAALGAASTRVAGLVDRIIPGGASRDPDVVERALALATQHAVLAGAREGSVEVTDVDESPLAYVPGDLVRLQVRASGEVP